jgi:hypothetical protein
MIVESQSLPELVSDAQIDGATTFFKASIATDRPNYDTKAWHAIKIAIFEKSDRRMARLTAGIRVFLYE